MVSLKHSLGYEPCGTGEPHPGTWLRSLVEPREQALTVLVPEGWIAEGGVVRIDPRLGPTNSVGVRFWETPLHYPVFRRR